MKTTDLQTFISDEAIAFAQFAAPLTEAQFSHKPNGRWSVGDTAQHLYLSVRPVVRVLSSPREIFEQWSNAEEPSRSYDVLAELYLRILQTTGIKAPASFAPRPDDVPANKVTMLTRLTDTYLALANLLTAFSNEEMDRYQMPHPALGMLSVREMILFTGVHTRHHIAVLQAY